MSLSAAERAYVHTRNQIISGALAGGGLVSEVEISAELGISRTPVHEAFLRLATEQLLDLVPRKGAVVRPVTASEVSDVLTMRRGIETAAVAQALETGPTDSVAKELAANLAEQQAAVVSTDLDGFAFADDEFHAILVAASNNPIARSFYHQVRARQQRLRNLWLRIDPAHLAAALDDHHRIAAQYSGGDTAAITAELTAHLDRYRGAL